MTRIAFADRSPTSSEIERIRLLLSTYQDGTGMNRNGKLPGWRDYERSVARALGGEAQESKAVFDVLLADPMNARAPKCGISCKMRSELDRLRRDGRLTIEVSNAAGEFWGALRANGITESTLAEKADQAGCIITSVVRAWHDAVSTSAGGEIDLARSFYLVLLWNQFPKYQLFQFSLDLWDPTKLHWSVPSSGKRLCGHDGTANLIEWYLQSGGQLKLYPLASRALWKSELFELEPLPAGFDPNVTRAATYFPEKWKAVASQSDGV